MSKNNNAEPRNEGVERTQGRLIFALIGGILILNSFLLGVWLPEQQFSSQLNAFLGAFIMACPIVYTAVKDLLRGKVYMNELVALAILSAFAAGSFQLAGVIGFFLLLTIIIENRTASGAQRSIEELIKLTPNSAHMVNEDGNEVDCDVSELSVGSIIRVRPGENFPVDGVIVSGESTVNQASITGESVPVDKEVGGEVYAGTQNLTGAVEIRVTRLGEDTTLGKVKEMILAAESSKTPIVRIIDRYAGYYTPTILMLAAVVWWLTKDMNQVIALMVIACPCAIVLATPSAIVAAVAAAARLGILIKNVNHLELAARIKAFVFDKTGTLTDGVLSVVKLAPADGIAPAVLLKYAAGAEQSSNHPTALALVNLARDAGLTLPKVGEVTEIHGKGVEAVIDGHKIRVGRAAWLASCGMTIPSHEEESDGMSVVFAACDDQVLGWAGLKDKLRKDAAETIVELRKLGVAHCAMVTGDRKSVAETVAAKLEIDEFRSECLPETKVEYVEKVKKDMLVAVVGDGVNDAPALAAGSLGIAMGAIGSDIAINSASIALMNNDLRRIPMLVYLSQKSRMVIIQNFLIGMLFVFGGIALAVFDNLTPIWAAILQTISTVLVIFNSARLVRTGEELTFEDNAAADSAADTENNL